MPLRVPSLPVHAAAVFEHEPRTGAALLISQHHVLELVVRKAPLRDVLDALLRGVETQSPGMLSSILLLDPDGVHIRHGAAPNLPAT